MFKIISLPSDKENYLLAFSLLILDYYLIAKALADERIIKVILTFYWS
jgi:hypothetical protein